MTSDLLFIDYTIVSHPKYIFRPLHCTFFARKKYPIRIDTIIIMGNRSSAYEFDKLDELKQTASLNTNQLNELYSKGSILQTNIEEVQRGDEKLLEKSTKEMNSSVS